MVSSTTSSPPRSLGPWLSRRRWSFFSKEECRVVGNNPNCIAKKVGVEEFTVEKLRGNMEALNREAEGDVVNVLLAQELSDYLATEVVRHRNPAA